MPITSQRRSCSRAYAKNVYLSITTRPSHDSQACICLSMSHANLCTFLLLFYWSCASVLEFAHPSLSSRASSAHKRWTFVRCCCMNSSGIHEAQSLMIEIQGVLAVKPYERRSHGARFGCTVKMDSIITSGGSDFVEIYLGHVTGPSHRINLHHWV
jgi:hypothetical protein